MKVQELCSIINAEFEIYSNTKQCILGDMHEDFAKSVRKIIIRYGLLRLKYCLWNITLDKHGKEILKANIEFIDYKNIKNTRKGILKRIWFEPINQEIANADIENLEDIFKNIDYNNELKRIRDSIVYCESQMKELKKKEIELMEVLQ